MTLLNRLSSAIGVKTQNPNREAADACVHDPKLLEDIAAGLAGQNPAIVGDCAEVMAKVAEASPLLIAPYIGRLAPLLTHKTTRVRWESAHAISLAAPYSPQHLFPLLRTLTKLLRDDPSVVVRDYAVDALIGYGATGDDAAELVFPPLRDAFAAWNGKQLARILGGLPRLAAAAPSLARDLRQVALFYAGDSRTAVRESALALQKALTQG
jgi:hypothetical protein